MVKRKTAEQSPELSVEEALSRIDSDGRTHAFCPLAQWSPLDDERVARMAALAQHASKREGDRWAIVAARAWLDVAQVQPRGPKNAHKNAVAALDAITEESVESLRWRAHADAVLARSMDRGAKGYLAALERYRAVLARDPADLSSMVMAAACARHAASASRHSKRWAKEGQPLAEQSLELLRAAPDEDPRVLLERGLALESLGRGDEALAALERAIELARASQWDGLDVTAMDLAWTAVATLHEAAGRQAKADAWRRTQIEREPARAYGAVSALAHRMKAHEEWAALVALLDGLPPEVPWSAELSRELATAKVFSGDHAGAKVVIERWRATVDAPWPSDWGMFYLLGLCERALGDRPAAVRAFDQAMALTPDNPTVFPFLACTLEELGDPERCVTVCERALSVMGRHKNVLHAYGGALRALNRHEEAKSSLREAIARGETDAAADLLRWYGERA
jgi:tetratricopeptide (TPR) repeat protein